jgi:hypothetical protein
VYVTLVFFVVQGLFARRRMLLLTLGPHLYYVDPANMVLKGEIPWSHELRVEPKNFKIFFVHTVRFKRDLHFGLTSHRTHLEEKFWKHSTFVVEELCLMSCLGYVFDEVLSVSLCGVCV